MSMKITVEIHGKTEPALQLNAAEAGRLAAWLHRHYEAEIGASKVPAGVAELRDWALRASAGVSDIERGPA